MADTVDVRYIYPPNYDNAPNPFPTRRVVVQMTCASDGTGETDVTKVRLSELMKHDGSTPTRTAIERIEYNIAGMWVKLEWDRAPHAEIAYLGPGSGVKDYRQAGGLVDPGEEGDRTGDIILTSSGYDSTAEDDSYDITLTIRLK